jgi:hypothetical protein
MNTKTNANTPADNSNGSLHYFIQPAILQQIGTRRLAKLLNAFGDDCKTANIVPPSDSENEDYFPSLADGLASPALPGRLRAALLSLETAAAPENRDRLDSTIQRRIPCVSLAGCCPLDCALELWFQVPEELSQFQTNGALASSPEPAAAVQSNGPPPPIQESSNPPIQSGATPPLHHSTTPSFHPVANPSIQPAVRPSASTSVTSSLGTNPSMPKRCSMD